MNKPDFYKEIRLIIKLFNKSYIFISSSLADKK